MFFSPHDFFVNISKNDKLDEAHSDNMYPFTYQCKGETFESLYAISLEKGDLRYKVKLRDVWFTIVPLTFPPTNEKKILWHQSNKDGELILSHDLVQAMGEGIEASQ
jgi:hypothetical protein